MHPRADELVRTLNLAPHPEGGFYREIWRSGARVQTDQGSWRDALTTIYFLLAAGTSSAWHRVKSDEVWHWYEGGPLELFMMAPDLGTVRSISLGPVRDPGGPVATVPANWWQAARPLGAYALCGCTVAPGFEFDDFCFLRDDPAAAGILRRSAPDLAALL